MTRRISNRRYPEVECANPECQILFEPHDRRQIYCERQCGINYNNDKRYHDNNTRFAGEKKARKNNNILKAMWNRKNCQKKKQVSIDILEWEGFSFETMALNTKNVKTGSSILWYHDFGLELIDREKHIFEIHNRS